MTSFGIPSSVGCVAESAWKRFCTNLSAMSIVCFVDMSVPPWSPRKHHGLKLTI